MALAGARKLAALAPAPAADAATCRLTIRLLDGNAGKPLPGLVRVTLADGNTVPLAGLVSRGTKLRNGHPAKNWFALVEPAPVSVPQALLTIEGFSGLETEMARTTLDLSGKTSARVDLQLHSFINTAAAGWFSGNTHLHLSGLSRAQADEYLRALPRADRLDLVFVSYLERAGAGHDYISNGYTLAGLAGLERLGGTGLLFGTASIQESGG